VSASDVKKVDTTAPGVPRPHARAVSRRVSRTSSSRFGTWTTSWWNGSSKCRV
jgi:hypothetical protein